LGKALGLEDVINEEAERVSLTPQKYLFNTARYDKTEMDCQEGKGSSGKRSICRHSIRAWVETDPADISGAMAMEMANGAQGLIELTTPMQDLRMIT